MGQFDEEVAAFIAAPKTALSRLRWSKKGHPDYLQCRASIAVSDGNGGHGEIILTAHVTRDPRKYSFSMIFRGERVLGLDVEPGGRHTNMLTMESVDGTHWQEWPTMDAEPDGQTLNHKQWFRKFCKRANVEYPFAYTPPTHDIPDDADPPEQGGLL